MSLLTVNGKLDRIFSSTRIITLTAKTVNNWDLSGSSAIVCNLDTNAITNYLSVTGILAGQDGEIKILIPNHSTKYIIFYHDNSNSDANNRIFCPDNSIFRAAIRGGVILMYLTSTNRWHIVGETGPSGSGFASCSIGSVGGGGP